MQTDFLLRLFEWVVRPSQNDRKLNLFVGPEEEIEQLGDKQGDFDIVSLSVVPGTGTLFGTCLTLTPKNE